jgi:UDP-glucose 4-epimerase
LALGCWRFVGFSKAWPLRPRCRFIFPDDRLEGARYFLTGVEDNLPDGTKLIRDLRDGDAVRPSCQEVDLVFHHAAVPSVVRSMEEPLLSLECNVNSTVILLMAAQEEGILLIAAQKEGIHRVIYASSSIVFRDNGGWSTSPYAATMFAAIKRPSTVSLSRIAAGAGRIAESRPPEARWDGKQSRDFTYIDDVLRANLPAD